MDVTTLRFTHSQISSRFKDKSPVWDTIESSIAGTVPNFPSLRIVPELASQRRQAVLAHCSKELALFPEEVFTSIPVPDFIKTHNINLRSIQENWINPLDSADDVVEYWSLDNRRLFVLKIISVLTEKMVSIPCHTNQLVGPVGPKRLATLEMKRSKEHLVSRSGGYHVVMEFACRSKRKMFELLRAHGCVEESQLQITLSNNFGPQELPSVSLCNPAGSLHVFEFGSRVAFFFPGHGFSSSASATEDEDDWCWFCERPWKHNGECIVCGPDIDDKDEDMDQVALSDSVDMSTPFLHDNITAVEPTVILTEKTTLEPKPCNSVPKGGKRKMKKGGKVVSKFRKKLKKSETCSVETKKQQQNMNEIQDGGKMEA